MLEPFRLSSMFDSISMAKIAPDPIGPKQEFYNNLNDNWDVSEGQNQRLTFCIECLQRGNRFMMKFFDEYFNEYFDEYFDDHSERNSSTIFATSIS